MLRVDSTAIDSNADATSSQASPIRRVNLNAGG